jgi:hypothetical protein
MNTVATPVAVIAAAADLQPSASGTWRLKNHVFFRDTPEGVHFDAGKQAFVLPGAGLYPLVARVLGLMDQGLPLARIEAAVPPRLQTHLHRLLAALRAHDMLLDDEDDCALLLAADAPLPLREFVKHLQDQLPAASYRPRLTAWRQAAVLLVGQGQALKAAAKALADSGVGHLSLRVATGSAVSAAELQDHVLSAGVRGQTVDVRAAAAAEADFAAAALALFASDELDASAQALAFDAQAAALGVPALVAGRFGGHAFVLPLAEAGVAGLAELLQWRAADDGVPHSPASLALLGAVAAQQALAWHFGIGVARLRRQAHEVSPYFDIAQRPLVGGRSDVRPAVRGALAPLPPGAHASKFGLPAERTLANYETLRMQLAPWFDAHTGPLVLPNERLHGVSLAQLPLYHEAVLVRVPRPLPGRADRGAAAAPRLVAGWGLNAEQAGLRALSLALAQLAQHCTDPRRSVPATRVVAFERERFEALALAQALAAAPEFADQRCLSWIEPGAADDGVLHLLRQLLRHFTAEPVRLLLHWHPQQWSFVAQCVLGASGAARVLASACDTSPRAALQEAVGLACSHLQLQDLRVWRGPAWAFGAARPQQWRPAPALDATALAARPAARFLMDDGLALPPGIWCGQACSVGAPPAAAVVRASEVVA